MSMKVNNLEELHAIQKPEENALVKVGESEYYIFKEGKWESYTPQEYGLSLYEASKQVYSKNEKYTKEKIYSKVKDYLYDVSANYYMLLNNEFKYYTIFSIGHGQDYLPVRDEVVYMLVECLDSVHHIERTGQALEIWGYLDGKFGLFMLFNYDGGVIECR